MVGQLYFNSGDIKVISACKHCSGGTIMAVILRLLRDLCSLSLQLQYSACPSICYVQHLPIPLLLLSCPLTLLEAEWDITSNCFPVSGRESYRKKTKNNNLLRPML